MPIDPKTFADSAELFDISEKIGKDFGLHIDQIGELDAQIRAVLRGKAKSAAFIEDICKYLEIKRDLAAKIAERVNSDVFIMLKSKMQENTATRTSTAVNYGEPVKTVSSYVPPKSTPIPTATVHPDTISHIESMGNFLIEQEKPAEHHFTEGNTLNRDVMKSSMKAAAGIEVHDLPSHHNEPPTNLPSIPEEMPTKPAGATTENKIPPVVNIPRYDGSDPYKEPLKIEHD